MSEADDLGRGHAAQIGGAGDDGDEKSSPGTTSPRRKAAEDQTGAARPKTTTRRKAEARKSGAGTSAARRRRSTPATGSALDRDMEEHAAETYTEAELEAGKKLAMSILSKAVTSGGLAAMLSVLMPGAGAGAGGLTALLSKLSETYGDLSAQDQKHLRAVVAWVKSGFQLKLES